MQNIDECDKIPKDDSPAHTVVGKHYNTLMTQPFNVIPSETLQNLKLKVQLAHMTKWLSHLSRIPTSVGIQQRCTRAELRASYCSHQRDVIMPNSYTCHLNSTESNPLVTFFKLSLLQLPHLNTIKMENIVFSASALAFSIPKTCLCYLDRSKQALYTTLNSQL